MKGHLGLVVDRAFVELWQPLTEHEDCPPGIFGEIFYGIRPNLREPKPIYTRAEDGTIRDSSVQLDDLAARAIADPSTAEELLAGLSMADFESEHDVLAAISSTFDVLVETATDKLADRFLELLRAFVDCYSLRYYVDEHARFWVSFAGLATALFGQLQNEAEGHPHLRQELVAFEHALAECLSEPNDIRIKTTIQKQVNCLEAFGIRLKLKDANTLGKMLRKLQENHTWPHESLAESALSINKFANDYPGIRHAGTFDSAKRELDLRDLASVTLSLVGLVPYMADGLDTHIGAAVRGNLVDIEARNGAAAPWAGASKGDSSSS